MKCSDQNSSQQPRHKFVTGTREKQISDNVLTGHSESFGYRDGKVRLLGEELKLFQGRFQTYFRTVGASFTDAHTSSEKTAQQLHNLTN